MDAFEILLASEKGLFPCVAEVLLGECVVVVAQPHPHWLEIGSGLVQQRKLFAESPTDGWDPQQFQRVQELKDLLVLILSELQERWHLSDHILWIKTGFHFCLLYM